VAEVGVRPEPQEDARLPVPPEIERDIEYPAAPFLGHRLIEAVSLQSVMSYINEKTLFHFQWGYRRKNRSVEAHRRFTDEHVRPIYHALMKRCAEEGILQPRAAYGYWPCSPEGDALVLFDPDGSGREVARFGFPRQSGKKSLCISDFFHADNGTPDTVALQVVTVGQQASETARSWFAEDRYQDYLHLHGLSVETAEGLAEYVHRQIRGELGFADEDAREMNRLFKQGYRGARYSFGYPACPNLKDQEQLLALLHADELGIQMSDEHQLWPEQSTSAIVVHHPEARYFTI
ncbi:MAG: vitamin B12 dependent-methionine synthase activation domain-containing protein, partial [Planctomycetota bacterium]|nr:vitamin B12 dependent-methionine synthase activation domain-containing protein [Planctomycetota bacterium]